MYRALQESTDSLQCTTRVERTLQRKRWRNTPKFFRPSEIWWKKGPSSPPLPVTAFQRFFLNHVGRDKEGTKKERVFFHGGITRRNKGICCQQRAGIIIEDWAYTAFCLAKLGENVPDGVICTVMDGPHQREGMGLLEYQVMRSLRDVAHDGWLCTFTIFQQLEILSACSWVAPVRETSTIWKSRRYGPSYHIQNHSRPCHSPPASQAGRRAGPAL